jgi:hypothetical protein
MPEFSQSNRQIEIVKFCVCGFTRCASVQIVYCQKRQRQQLPLRFLGLHEEDPSRFSARHIQCSEAVGADSHSIVIIVAFHSAVRMSAHYIKCTVLVTSQIDVVISPALLLGVQTMGVRPGVLPFLLHDFVRIELSPV